MVLDFRVGCLQHLKQDLKYFKDVTTHGNQYSNVVIMGRKTWDSLPIKPCQTELMLLLQETKIIDVFRKIFKI